MERVFPFENLIALREIPIKDTDQFTKPNMSDWARYLGVTRESIRRWMQKGIPEFRADQIAVQSYGMHPCLIWPDWFPKES